MTTQNRALLRLPRWLMWLLIGLYAIPGLLARDPWKPEDALGFGVSATMSEGGLSDWLIPNIYGVPLFEEGPLAAWLGGLFGKAWLDLGFSHYWLDDVIRLSCLVWIVLLAWAVWETAFRLAKRPELQPPDPLGLSPSRLEYARTVADAGVLCLLATLGLLLRAHQSVAEVAELTGIAIVILSVVRSLDRPISAGWGLGVGLLVTLLARGWVHLAFLLCALIISSLSHATLRFGLGSRLLRALAILLLGWAAWTVCLENTPGGGMWLDRWWQWNAQQLVWTSDNLTWSLNLKSGLKAGAWFFWPTWPLALWGAWHYRHSLKEPSLRVPLAALLGLWLGLICTKGNQESDFFPLIVPLALLAALGLPTLRRALISLIDWFAVTSFTTASILIWLGWTAITFGMPEKIARNFNRLAPGFTSVVVPIEVVIAVGATLAWLLLVVWRVKTHPRALWRAMVLSTGGTTLVWLLLMTLWLPWINHGKTYKYVADNLQRYTTTDAGCVATRNLGLAQRAALVYHANLNVRRDAYLRKNLRADECSWLLIQTSPNSTIETVNPSKWDKVWEGGRSSDKDEKFVLYKRHEPTPALAN